MKKLILILAILISNTAWADSISVQGGWLHTQNSNYGDGEQIQARAEKELIVNKFGSIGAGLEYGYHGKTSRYAEEGTQYGRFSGHTIMGEAIYHTPEHRKVSLYILAGLGWGWWNFDEAAYSKEAGITVDAGNNWCQKYGLGADYRLNENWSLNLEWGYFQTDIPKNAHYSDGSFSNIMDTGKTIGEGETYLIGGVKFKW